jgi:hypothetical protein
LGEGHTNADGVTKPTKLYRKASATQLLKVQKRTNSTVLVKLISTNKLLREKHTTEELFLNKNNFLKYL